MLSVDEQRKKIKKGIWESFVFNAFFIIFALILLFRSDYIIQNFVIAVAFLGIICGGMSLLIYYRLDKKLRIYSDDLSKGLLFLLFSIVALIKTNIFVNMFTFMIGGYLIFKYVERLQSVLQLRNLKKVLWNVALGISVLCIILGMIILLNPFDGKIPLSNVVAVCLISAESLGIVQNILFLIGMGRENGTEEK